MWNPFKNLFAHIVRFNNGDYAIRKFSVWLGWVYLDANQVKVDNYWVDNYWWSANSIPNNKYCTFFDLKNAEERLRIYKEGNPKRDFGTRVQ